MKIATAAYAQEILNSFDAYAQKITNWVSEAQDADVLVFPEYGAMELATIEGKAGDLETCIHATSDLMPRAVDLHKTLARQFGCHILMASAPVVERDRPVNRAYFIGPDGQVSHQDKQIMTRYERDPWDIVSGHPLRVFDTVHGRMGVLICYDSEFPLLGRALIDAGVDVLLVPSCTEGLDGYWRVRIGAMARALEGQCVVAHSPTVLPAPWCPAIEGNTGAAGIYGPPDEGFPDTGVIALGGLNEPGWVSADIDVQSIARIRENGRVLNKSHWLEQADCVNSVDYCDFRRN